MRRQPSATLRAMAAKPQMTTAVGTRPSRSSARVSWRMNGERAFQDGGQLSKCAECAWA